MAVTVGIISVVQVIDSLVGWLRKFQQLCNGFLLFEKLNGDNGPRQFVF
jgi:hypothetical protein